MKTKQETSMKPRQQLAQHMEQLVAERHDPSGNIHLPEMEIKTISASQLVKQTAAEYADKLIKQKTGKPWEDDVHPIWTFKGNGLADKSLPREDGWVPEIEAEVPIPGFHEARGGDVGQRWRLRVHPDGVIWGANLAAELGIRDPPEAYNQLYGAAEHKCFVYGRWLKTEAARRQGNLGAAAIHEQGEAALEGEDWALQEPKVEAHRGRDAIIFREVEYTEDGTKAVAPNKVGGHHTFTYEPGMEPGALITVEVNETPPFRREPEPITIEECQDLLGFLLQKCAVILEAVETEDLQPAFEWDWDHGYEFSREWPELDEGYDESFDELLAEERGLNELIQDLEDDQNRLQQEMKARMAANDLGRVEKIVEVDGVRRKFSVNRQQRQGNRNVKVDDAETLAETIRTVKQAVFGDGNEEKAIEMLRDTEPDIIGRGSPYDYTDIREMKL